MTARKTPFYDVGVEYGADMRELFGYWLPWAYRNGEIEEHLSTRTRASVCDLDYMAECAIEGKEALAFVQQLFTADLSTLAVGAIRYTAMCNPQGGMVDDGTVWRMSASRYMFVSGDEADYEWVAAQAKAFDVTLTNLTSAWTTLALQGPLSTAVLAKLTEAPITDIRYYHFIEGTVAGIECVIARMGYTGEFGYELHFRPQHGEQMWRSLFEAGVPEGLEPLGQAALESLRQEAGYLLVGNDHDATRNPFEAGIGSVVRLDKEAFIGKQALSRVLEDGIERTMVWFKLGDQAVPVNGDAVRCGGRQVGTVTSGSYSPTFDRGVAMAYVEPRSAVCGAVLTVHVGEADHRATLSTMPLYDPGDVRSKNL